MTKKNYNFVNLLNLKRQILFGSEKLANKNVQCNFCVVEIAIKNTRIFQLRVRFGFVFCLLCLETLKSCVIELDDDN
jgi:hypothetical protein